MNDIIIKKAALKKLAQQGWHPSDMAEALKFVEDSEKIKAGYRMQADAAKAATEAKSAFSFGNLGKKILIGSGAILGVIGVTAAVDAIMDYFKQRGSSAKSKEYFAKMLEAHPQLQKEDPVTLAKYWESLYHFAPYMAEDPLAAGAYLTQSISRASGSEFGGPPPDTFSTLADIQKKHKESTKSDKLTDEARKVTTTGILSETFKDAIKGF